MLVQVSKLTKRREYWGHLLCLGSNYGYYPNAQKTALVTKEQHLSEAEHLFNDTGIEITAAGHRYLGGALGSKAFRKDYYLECVARWQVELTIIWRTWQGRSLRQPIMF